MSVNSKMTAIADAIRAKTGGTGTLTLDQMAVEIAGITTEPAFNFLDNSDFTNPVNQRGQSSYTGNGYTIDRWRTVLDDSTHTITPAGLKISGSSSKLHSLQTSIENPTRLVGRTFTLCAFIEENNATADLQISIYYGNGSNNQTASAGIGAIVPAGTTGLIIATGVLSDMGGYAYANACVRVRNGTGDFTVKWMALYEGEYTAETLPKYTPKGLAAEQAECLRFYHVYATSGARPAKGFDCSPPMRINNVTQGSIYIDGAYRYYNSADL